LDINDNHNYNYKLSFDFVIGNPPYNNNGLKKVPTNKIINKKEDGNTIWCDFIKKSVGLLKDKGEMVVIIPSIWLKPDKIKMYDFMMNYKIEKLNCMNNTETNKVFNRYAQTPTCYFKLTKTHNPGFITIWDRDQGVNENSTYYIRWDLKSSIQIPIPVFGAGILKKIYSKLRLNDNDNNYDNRLKVFKTNLPIKKSMFSDVKTIEFEYPNIKTCQLQLADKAKPNLVIEYSNFPQPYYGEPKLVFAHKMYGFPYLDASGIYGISNRDNYIIKNKSLYELKRLKDFFSTKIALYLFETTRYRMKYLEKYIFELIPDITKLEDFPEEINDITIGKYFNLGENEMNAIYKLHKKEYQWF
jgi:hypothetical protein